MGSYKRHYKKENTFGQLQKALEEGEYIWRDIRTGEYTWPETRERINFDKHKRNYKNQNRIQ